MLKTGLSHGVAIVPNAPKQRYSDPVTGAHFEFEDMCQRLERLRKMRIREEMQSSGLRKSLSRENDKKQQQSAKAHSNSGVRKN